MWYKGRSCKPQLKAGVAREVPVTDEKDPMTAARTAMVAEIAGEVEETRRWLNKAALDPRVMAAMSRVPRHQFVTAENRERAYENRPLRIGYGQTISQPYIVAAMTDLAAPGPTDRVLEVGTGCGYQTAVLAELAGQVYSIEVVPQLAEQAAERLKRLGYAKVQVRRGDGAKGWPEHAPFDAIVVTAAAFRQVPPALIEQLALGGRLVIPVERPGSGQRFFDWRPSQELILVTKDQAGQTSEACFLPVAFVPLVEGRDEPTGVG
jgi:protein-L-isoaspartate(D-aspartate) O-methyltransferase